VQRNETNVRAHTEKEGETKIHTKNIKIKE
jgi:hypothetical protein